MSAQKRKSKRNGCEHLQGRPLLGANGDIWTIEEHGVLRTDAAGHRSSSPFNQARAVVSAILE
ncbi:hypothetical protein BG57_18260 [Caballeronia grimmiae]|uniref:Uncharacterized protein n=1 Tax=Caballeronia grimmiae TaxID=1071679 RepID=A0A069NMB8_9BURK|nr:hypothetical protein BG57_18260 [Caballeronia grimmiae]